MKKANPQAPKVSLPPGSPFDPWSLLPVLALGAAIVFFSDFKILFQDFVTTGPKLLICNALRVTTLFCMAIALYGGGVTASRALNLTDWIATLSLSERILIRFFLGAAGMTLLMFPLGLLGLYYAETAFLLGALFIIPGFSNFRGEARAFLKNLFAWLSPSQPSTLRIFCRWTFTGALSAGGIALLLTRCLYPGETSNDSYEIYWPYQMQTVASHTLAPNDLWYMFCSFNGAGINFWSMLLTDLLGIQSVTFIFLLSGCLATYCVSRRVGIGVDSAVGVSLISLQCFLFTNPFWGAFQSHHLQLAAWLAAAVWALLTFRETPSPLKRKAALAASSILVGIALVFPLFLVFLGPTLLVLGLLPLLQRDGSTARGVCVMILMAAGASLGLMTLNYLINGMPLQNPTGPMWKLSNQSQFSRWCSPYNMYYLFEGSNERTTSLSLGGLFSKPSAFWEHLLRMDSYGIIGKPGFVFPISLLAFVSVAFRRYSSSRPLLGLAPLGFPLLTCLLITNTSHPDSVYRNYGFVCFLIPPLLFAFSVLALRLLPTPPPPASPIGPLVLLLIALSPSAQLAERYQSYCQRHQPQRASDFIRFALGHLSVQDALMRGDGLWLAAQQARNTIGLNEKIFSFCHPPPIASFLFPGEGLLTEPSRYGFGGKWDTIVFGDADTAMNELKRQNINHFLIDFSQPFFGALAYSPLFEPAKFAERFEVVTGIENSVLLTWKKGVAPMPSAVSNAWSQRVALSRSRPDPHPDGVMARLYDNIKAIYEYNAGKPLPIQRPPALPKVTGWQ
jgi:hypothetical protein